MIYAALVVAAFLALGVVGTTGTSTAATPTFAKDVAPILYKNCASCHRPGDIAPMSLLRYEEARPWAKAIREQVATGQMPPWHATQPHGTFLNDRRVIRERARVGDEIGFDKLRFRLSGAAAQEPVHIQATKVALTPRGGAWLWGGLAIAIAAAVITIVLGNT